MILALPSSIGEVIIALGFCDYLTKTRGELTLLMRPEHKLLLKFFRLKNVSVKLGSLTQIRDYAESRGFSIYQENQDIVSIDPFSNGNLCLYTKVRERNCSWTPVSYIKWCLGIPDEINPELPSAECIQAGIDSTQMKRAFLSLGSNTNSPLPDVFTTSLVEELKGRGYDVIFNVAGAFHIPLVKNQQHLDLVRLDLIQCVQAYLGATATFVSASGLSALFGAVNGLEGVGKPPLFVLKTDRIRVEREGEVVDEKIFGNQNFRSFLPNSSEMVSNSGAYIEVEVPLSISDSECRAMTQELMRDWIDPLDVTR